MKIIYTLILITIILISIGWSDNPLEQVIKDPAQRGLQTPGVYNSIRWEWEGEPQWLTGVNWGGLNFNGGLDFGINYFGSSIAPEDVPNIEIRFSNTETSQGYIYRRDFGYAYFGLGTFPGSVWDISNQESPRRLDICFVEWSDTVGGKTANQMWDPDTSDLGKREYLYILNSTYNPNVNDPFYSQKSILDHGDEFPVLYSLWSRIIPGFSLLQVESLLRIINVPVYFQDITIQELQNVPDPTENDTSMFFGDTVRVTGLIMNDPRDLWVGARWAAFITDPVTHPAPGSGMLVIQHDTTVKEVRFQARQTGELCEFIGVVNEFNHFTEIELITDTPVPVRSIEVIDPLPEPVLITASELSEPGSAEKWESMFVRIENGRILVNDFPDYMSSFADRSGASSFLADYFKWFYDGLLEGTYMWPPQDTRLHLNGFVRDEVTTSLGRIYTINPRNEGDFEFIEGVPEVILTDPNGGEIANQASYRLIRWKIYDIADIQNLKIEYSLDDGLNFTTIIDRPAGPGLGYSWFVPDVVSQSVRTRVTVTDNNSNTYSDLSDNAFEIRKLDRYVYNTETLSHTIRADGTSGNTGISNEHNLDEPSLEFPAQSGHHHLFMSDLIVGMIRAAGDTTFLMPFNMKFYQTHDMTSADLGDYIETTCQFTDFSGLGLEIEQKSYARTGESWVILDYLIRNSSDESYKGLIAAIHNDFDINQYNTNLVRYNEENRLAYMFDATSGWTSMAGICLLSQPVQSFRRYSGAEGPQSEGEMYRILAVQEKDDPGGDIQADYRFIMSDAPRDLGPAETTDFTFALVAGNGETGILNASEQAQTFWISFNDQIAPSIGNTSIPVTSIGNSMTINVNVTDNSGLQSVILYYRKGGDISFNSVVMSQSGASYQATIPQTYVTDSGIEIRIEAEDLNDNLAVIHRMVPVQIPDGHLQTEVSGGAQIENYQMISIPMAPQNGSIDNVLVDDFGVYNNTQWRLFYDTGTSLSEYPNTGSFAPGKAFWLITRSTHTIDIPAGATVSAADYYTITLHGGWNQIASPYNFDVGWNDLMTLNNQPNIDGPFFYRGQTGYSLEELISPFDGCYVNNMAGSNFQLKIPLKGKDANSTKPSLSTAYWCIRIQAESEGIADYLTTLGIRPESSVTWDRYDHLEPPIIGKYISAYFPHSDWQKYPANYAIDFRPMTKDGCIWDVEVRTNIQDCEIELRFIEENRELLPAQFKIYLIDPEARLIRDLREQPVFGYTTSGSNEIKKRLQLIIGTEQYIAEKIPDLPIIPLTLELRQNYPNPFNPATQITFGLPANSQVNLTIYDLNGRVVDVLYDGYIEAGYRVLRWDGTNKRGGYVASGVYIYCLTAGDKKISRKMILIR